MSPHIGRFTISKEFFEDLSPGEGINVFHNMVVLQAQRDWVSGRIEYFAIHPDFRMKAQGELVPEYRAQFNHTSSYPKWVEVKTNVVAGPWPMEF